MIPVKCDHPPGMVVIASDDLARYVDFEMSMYGLQIPRGSELVRKRGSSVARNRNAAVEQMKPHHAWICFLDDDHVVPGDTILKLLSHHKPIVGALYSSRRPPFYPIVMARRDGQIWNPYNWTALKEGPRLRQVAGCGTGGMLIRAEVFRKIPKPWFHATEWTDDLHFCDAATRAGIPIHLDRDAVLGHTCTHNVWPDMERGGVSLALDDVVINLSDDAGAAALTVEVTPGAEIS